jgi:hypothetical protein
MSLGNYATPWSGRRVVFDFGGAAEILLNDAGADRFKFEREIALLLLLFWTLWPEDNGTHRAVARLVSAAITFRKYDSAGNPTERAIGKITSIEARLGEPWYRAFYKKFFVHVGGLRGLVNTDRPKDYDRWAEERRQELEPCLDMIEYLIGMSRHQLRFVSRTMAAKFVSLNGFARTNNYGVSEGKKRLENRKARSKDGRTPVISKDAVYAKWDYAPKTICAAYVLKKTMPELWALKLSDPHMLSNLSNMAVNQQAIMEFFAQYHWLVEYFEQEKKFLKIKKLQNLPRLEYFERRQIAFHTFTDSELQIVKHLSPKSLRRFVQGGLTEPQRTT